MKAEGPQSFRRGRHRRWRLRGSGDFSCSSHANPMIRERRRSVHPHLRHVATDAVAGDGLIGTVRVLRVGTRMAVAATIVVVLLIGRHRTMRIMTGQAVEPTRRPVLTLPRLLELKATAERQSHRCETSECAILRLDFLRLEHDWRAVTFTAPINRLCWCQRLPIVEAGRRFSRVHGLGMLLGVCMAP